MGMKDEDGAIKQFGETLKLNPTCIKAYVARADIYMYLKQYRLAVNDFKEAL